jgi:hypothetical protein
MLRAAAIVLAALATVASCKKTSPREAAPEKVEPMSADEVKRSQDACQAYVDRACACAQTVPAVERQCQLARAAPDAVRVALDFATSPDSKPDIVRRSYASVRKTVKSCIEETAKLPAAGCP